MSNTKKIVVTGDVVVAHDIFQGARAHPDSTRGNGTRTHRTQAGAPLVHELLVGALEGDEELEVVLSVDPGVASASRTEYRLWRACGRGKQKVWGMTESLGSGEGDAAPAGAKTRDVPADVLVIEDAGIGLRHDTQHAAWPSVLREQSAREPERVIYQMGGPLGQGDLWRAVRARFADRTVLVVSIDDIRREAVRVTSGFSWERTALELVGELEGNPAVKPLLSTGTLVVGLGCEGALVVEGPPGGPKTVRLLFDPGHLEGEWAASFEGDVPDRMACLVAGITHHLARTGGGVDVVEGVRAGLSAARRLVLEGYGTVGPSAPGFPTQSVVAELQEPSHAFARVEVPPVEEDARAAWAVLSCGASCRPFYGLGRRVALLGTKALGDAPFARFGKLFTTDRREMESLRNIRQLIRDYERNDKGKKPLSIAVFGPPGSGKSFSIEEIAESALGKGVPTLIFNLSQFHGPEELAGALHQVRDKALEGRTPVVFWDEFDSGEYGWLQYLLAPMQDGAFREGQLEHRIGKCIFVFAGGTSPDFEHFGPPVDDPEKYTAFRLKKGPDFKSRLAGYLNVLGPNPRSVFDDERGEWVVDETDVCAPIRRGLLLRVMLGIYDDRRLQIDPGILSGILELGEYRHGARSLQTIVSYLKNRMTDGHIRRSDLPPAEVVSLHADYDDFMRRANWDMHYEGLAENLAPAIHAFYCELVQNRDELLPYRVEFEKLPAAIQDDNRAAAARIPRVLRMAGLYVVPSSGPEDKTAPKVLDVIEESIELLAEEEHDGWMDHRAKNGWVPGEPRNDDAKIHPLMKPYAELSPQQEDKDRNGVRKYPAILDLAGYKIVMDLPSVD